MFWECLGLRFGGLGVPKDLILGVQGSPWAPFWVAFGNPQAPGQAPRDSLCSKGGLDRFLARFWEPNGSPRGAKILPKSIKKSMNFGMRFSMKFGYENGAKMGPKSLPK